MPQEPLMVYPVPAPVHDTSFNLQNTLEHCLADAELTPQHGDVLAISSKYAAISEGRVVDLDAVEIGPQAADLAERYVMDPRLTELVVQEADHIFGGIVHDFNGSQVGFLLTHKDGITSPNAGLDRSNIPSGKVVLFPVDPYGLAARIRAAVMARYGVQVGVILTDSWLMPGRWGTTGVALATAGFEPVQDERGKLDLFGNPMQVTKRSMADSLCVCAQMVMGETAEATPVALIRNSGVQMTADPVQVEDVSIPWETCIYIGALTVGLLEDGAPENTPTERLMRQRVTSGD